MAGQEGSTSGSRWCSATTAHRQRLVNAMLNVVLDAEVMRAAPRPEPAPVRPVADPALTSAIAAATRAAVADLRARHPERFYAFALLTTHDALPPYLSASSVEGDARAGADRWDLAASPYAVWGYDEHFGRVGTADLSTLLASMEEALRVLDIDGVFGRDRDDVLLIAGTVPPVPADTGFVRRLNPPSAVRAEWLLRCSEQTPLAPETDLAGGSAAAPNPTIADLWRVAPGLSLPDGVTVYGPCSFAERNATFEAAEYVPGWAVVGDDSGGRGLLMRAPGPAFAPASGRTAAEVFALDLGALGGDVESDAEFVTDDLIGWLADRLQAGQW